jgi:hydroxymethylglutaryl-CoA lyase
MLPAEASIVEVGPRDGLQNEDAILATAEKVDLINRLIRAGAKRIETASFVHPKLVPQMADAEAVMATLGISSPAVSYMGLVLNRRGLDRALDTTVDEINFSVAATDGFSQSNQGMSVEEAMNSVVEMVPLATATARPATVTISVVWGCPFDGEVPISAVTAIAKRAVEAGATEIALGDTIGVAVPVRVTEMIEAVGEVVDGTPLRMHFHDTRNTGVANSFAAIQAGVTTLDASVGGAGGCPFAPNATGNVATEDVLYMLERSGVATAMRMAEVAETGRWLSRLLGRDLPAAVGKAGGFPA